MQATLLEVQADFPGRDRVPKGAELKILLDGAGDKATVILSLKIDTTTNSLVIPCKADGLDSASFSYRQLDRVYTITLNLDAPVGEGGGTTARARFAENGIVGANFGAKEKLKAVTIVLRPRPAGGDWTSECPCLSVISCWELNGVAGEETKVLPKQAGGNQIKISAGAKTTIEICAILSTIHPGAPKLGHPNFQLRLDLPSFGLATDWLPFSRLGGSDGSGGPGAGLGPLIAWFGKLIAFNWETAPPRLPEWKFDFPLRMALPLGVRVKETRLSLRRGEDGALIIDAVASGFYLAWRNEQVTQPRGKITLTYNSGVYTLNASLYVAQYPADESWRGESFGFELPFDLLGLTAEAWWLGVGLYFSNAGARKDESLGPACFQALLEIGGLMVKSRFKEGKDGLYRTDVRLLVRDTALISNVVDPAPGFFAWAIPLRDRDPFARWRGKPIPALSFARDLLAPPAKPSEDDYGLRFLDGDFRPGERAYLLWSMNGERLLKALAHDFMGRESAGPVRSDEAQTLYALEWTEAGGPKQLRLDWRSGEASQYLPGKDAPASHKDPCLKIKKEKLDFNVPLDANGVHLVGDFDRPVTLDLPAISIETARTSDQGIVLRIESDGSPSVGHLLFYKTIPRSLTDTDIRPFARATVGFSVKDRNARTQSREVVETRPEPAKPLPALAPGRRVFETDSSNEKPFLTLSLGYGPATPFAIRTIGWRKDQSPRFLQMPREGASQPVSLIPATLPKTEAGDPGCPGRKPPPTAPAALDFDSFATPSFSAEAWRLSVRIAAQDALFKMFDGAAANPNQRASFNIDEICIGEKRSDAIIRTSLTFKVGEDLELAGHVDFRFDFADLSISIAEGSSLALALKKLAKPPAWATETPLDKKPEAYFFSDRQPLLGLELTALLEKQPAFNSEKEPETIEALALVIRDGRFVLSKLPHVTLVLRYTGFGRDALTFLVDEFVLGPGGLDLSARLLPAPIRLQGLKNPFMLEQAALRIRASRMDQLTITGSGVLPEILDEAPFSVMLVFKQPAGENKIDLDGAKVKLGNEGKPIFSRGVRFKFEIEAIDLVYRTAPNGGARTFMFNTSGSAQFTPNEGEFTSGLLENLKSARLEFVNMPVCDEFVEHLQLSIELREPITFSAFDVFNMEIRSIGVHPKFPQFREPTPAIIIGGQIFFADVGDLVSADIDFHAGYIGMPAKGSSLPQIYFNGLRVDIATAEGFHIGGRVDTYDDADRHGFGGEGTVQIPGFPELSAAFAFTTLLDRKGDWLRAWFIAAEASKIGYPIGAALPIYLRQIGLGFGYRYTLPIIKTFHDNKDGPRKLMEAMLRALDNHQTLARIDSWASAAEGPLYTIAAEAVLSLGSANTSPFDYHETAEQKIRTLFVQLLAAFDGSAFLAAAKLWFPVSVDDFFKNKGGMRQRPLASGFLVFSPSQSRLLAHARKKTDPYLGEDPNAPIPRALKVPLEKSYFDATLLIEPGLVHAELGWFDRLMFELSAGPMRVGCRGGMLMRLERDLLIYGYYFSAYGELQLAGGLDLGFVGVRVEALVQVQYQTRLLIGANTRNPLHSNVYGAIGLDICVRFLVRAWLRLEFRFFSINIDISFSFNLQLSVIGEIGWAGEGDLGFRGRADLMLNIFGRALPVKIDVSLNSDAVNSAREAMAPYARSILEPGKAPAMPGMETLDLAALGLMDLPQPPAPTHETVPADGFVSVTMTGETPTADGDNLYFIWIMPGPSGEAFYPPEGMDAYATLDFTSVPNFDGENTFYRHQGKWENVKKMPLALPANKEAKVVLKGDVQDDQLTFPQMIAGCYVPTTAKSTANFPHDYNPNELVLPKLRCAKKALDDPRVFDPNDPACAPRRMLDRDNPYDRLMLHVPERAIDAADDTGEEERRKEKKRLEQQALGNQSILLQGFYDDLTRIARTTVWKSGNAPETPPLPTGRPTLFDLGLLLCVKAKELPDWARRRVTEGAPYPRLSFGAQSAVVHVVKPAIDMDLLDFTRTPPVASNATSYFDEEIVALAWRLDWEGAPKAEAQIARCGETDIEAYLAAYEICFRDATDQRVIYSTTATPCETMKEVGNTLIKVKRRFGFTISRRELLPLDTIDTLRAREIVATVMPISQRGARGRPIVFNLALRQTMTPLPADDPQLTLACKDNSWRAGLTWREPSLPPTPGVARTEGWELILRPLSETPLGAWPDQAADVTDRGLMSATGQDLIEGDVIVPLHGDLTPENPDHPILRPEGEEAPAVRELILTLDGKPREISCFDHLGRPLQKGADLKEAVEGFFKRRSAASAGGRSWRLFLRAVSKACKDGDRLPQAPVSSLAQVRLTLDAGDGTALRPLPFFEWPTPPKSGEGTEKAVPATNLRADVGPIYTPVVASDGKTLQFIRKTDTARAVTVAWRAIPDATAIDAEAPMPLEAFASYSVYEARLDGMTNFDMHPSARRIGRATPVDPSFARAVPDSMNDTQKWEAQYPVYARTRAHLEKLPPENIPPLFPGGWSWAESELKWPPRLTLEEIAGTDKTKGEVMRRWLDVGAAIAGKPLHPWLTLLLGALAEPSGGNYRVEVASGPPPAVASAAKWLEANSEKTDPYGWAALSTLGLSATISLRDAVTGLRFDLEKLLDEINVTIDNLFDRFPGAAKIKPHVLIDLPIQHAQAYRASPDTAAIGATGLVMAQIALRPLPSPVATYDIIEYEETLPTRAVEVTGRADIIIDGRDSPVINVASGQTLKTPLLPGEAALIRRFPAEKRDKPSPSAVAPLAAFVLDKTPKNIKRSPFGRFAPLPEALNPVLAENRNPDPVAGYNTEFCKAWLDYLADAFARGDAGADDPVASREKAVTKLRSELAAAPKIFEAYRTWSARFFATAPIVELWTSEGIVPDTDDARSDKGPARDRAAAQLKTQDPHIVAADGQGLLRFTRFVEEELAGVRAYQVTWEGRYDRLHRIVNKEAPEEKDSTPLGKHYAGVYLPRVRVLEPPTILAARTLRAQDGRPFHELVVTHPERALSERNTTVAAKLEFGDIRRRYLRHLSEQEFLDGLKRATLDDGTPLLDGATVDRGRPKDSKTPVKPPDLVAHDKTLLFVAPAARWGATRYQDAAEPFYYEQGATVMATASDNLTGAREIILPRGEPDALTPLPTRDGPPPSKIEPLSWDHFWAPPWFTDKWEPIRAARAERFRVWSRALADDAATPKAMLVALMAPMGRRVVARLPRYAESLSETLRTDVFEHETTPYEENGVTKAPAGLLPDPNTRLLITDIAPGETFATIAQITPVRGKEAGAGSGWKTAFRITAVSSDYEAKNETLLRPTKRGWPDGLCGALDIRPSFRDAVMEVSGPPIMGDITDVAATEEDKLIGPGELPHSGGLARLTPLALRLVVTSVDPKTNKWRVSLVSPLAAQRAIFRPHLDPASSAGQLQADQNDLSVALRLLLDIERRRAAARLARDVSIIDGKPDVASDANRLLADAGTAALVYVLAKGVKLDIADAVFTRYAEGGFTLWKRVQGERRPVWTQIVKQEDDEPEVWRIALARRLDAQTPSAEEINSFLSKYGEKERPMNCAIARALTDVAEALARKSHCPADMRDPAVFAQRGNDARVPWKDKETRP